MKRFWYSILIVVIGLGGFILGSRFHQFRLQDFSDLPQLLSDTPTREMAQDALNQHWAERSKVRVRVNFFTKINGQKSNFGVPVYKMDYTAEIEFLDNGFLLFQPFTEKHLVVSEKPKTMYEYPMYVIDKKIQAGETLTVNGYITFEKKEKGWEVDQINGSM